MLPKDKLRMREKEEIKDLDNIKPIDHGTIAKPHTPVYKMHRFFARRPYSVFIELIDHYSNPRSIVLDPFCGGGVTLVEGLKLRRKVIGVDINPLATFITRMEVVDVGPDELKLAFEELEGNVKDEILELYMTKCPKCGKATPADWFEWSNVVECPECNREVVLKRAKRVRKGEKIPGVSAGDYQCYNGGCKATFRPAQCKRLDDVLTAVHCRCQWCKTKSEFEPNPKDIDLAKGIRTTFEERVSEKNLWYPTLEMPNWWDLRRPYNQHIKKFKELFTPRNLLGNSILFESIRQQTKQPVREMLIFTHSASLRFSNRMVCRNVAWRGDRPLEWASSTYWLPEVHIEMNVWDAFLNRFKAILKGKTWSKKEIGTYCRFTDQFDELLDGATCQILTQSATNLPFPDKSIDTIITDPPYGNNVLYAELCNFYWAWVGHLYGQDGLINDREEAVLSKAHDKSLEDYRKLLYEVFKECYRVLKPGRWMVMTFHNKEFRVWNAIHLAAHDAGFVLSEKDGMIYQSPIQQYTRTIQQRRGGSMLGDFILSFQKAEKPPEKKMIPYVEVEKKIQELAAESVLHHSGAILSTIYMKIMPFLLNNNLLEKIQEKDLPPYLKDSFEERNGKWYLKENLADRLRNYLSDYSKSHYKEDYSVLDFVPVEARLEYLIRRYLYKYGYATQDEILNEIYSNLINSNAAEYGEISRVLNRIAELTPGPKGKRKVWRLKEDIEREKQLDLIEEKISEIVKVSEESEHDLMIRRLVELGAREQFACHIGRTEQRKYTEFRNLSIPMANNVQYGISQEGFRHVTEIDVLWLKGDAILSAFEVEKTTTIDSGINRLRNLFACQPNVKIESYLLVPDRRKSEVERKLKSPANIKDSLTKKIGYILFSDLNVRKDVSTIDFNKIKNWVRV